MRRLLHALKTILKALLLGLAAIALLVVGAVGVVWWKPGLLLNEKRVKQALRWAAPDAEVTWKSFAWSFTPEGALAKRTDLAVEGLCFRRGESLRGCAPELRIGLSFSVSGFRPRITRLGRLRVHATEVFLHPEPGPRAPERPLPDLRVPSLPALFAGLDASRLGELSVRLDKLTVHGETGPDLVARLALERTDGAPGTAAFRLSAGVEKGKDLSLRLSGDGALRPGREGLAWQGSLKGRVSGWRVQSPLELAWGENVELRLRPVLVKGPNRFTVPLVARGTARSLTLEMARLELDKLWPRKRVLLDSCRITSELDRDEGYPRKSALACGLTLVSLQRGALLPPMKAKLTADLALKPEGAQAVSGELEVHELGPNEYLESRLDFTGRGRVNLVSGEVEGEPKLELTANLRVPELQSWKRALEKTPYAVPAPFRVLAGPLSLSVHLDHAGKNELAAVADFKTDLHGGGESLVTASTARVLLSHPWRGKKALHVDARAELTDVALEAPPLKLEEPPPFLPDGRFRKTRVPVPTAAAQEETIPLDWRVALRTKAPVRIRTNLLPSPVPVAVSLELASGAGPEGHVDVQPMPIEVFNKKANLRKVNLTFRNGSAAAQIDGLVVYRNPEVTVRILLLGSTDKPRVDFLSNPPLNRQQIVSVLLFNKSIDQLTEEQASSAGSFSQATADGALGLFSLLFLSSTPVESISYDPVSQTYSARLRLDQKTTLSVGSDFERERQLALRRRLGGRWAIRTELHDEEGRPDVLLTLLEWFKRF
jgi:autotransporter translocation and assembly factor TamB